MIREEDLFNSIVSIEKETDKKISFENAKKLIEIINEKIIEKKIKNIKMSRDEFVNLVTQEALGLELSYAYCMVAYKYYGKARKKKAKV